MKYTKFILAAITITACSVLGAVFLGSQHADALTLEQSNYTNNLIDDSVFRDSTTMSPSAIQTFLSNSGSGLANFRDVENCGSSSGAHYAFYRQYYYCGTTQVAAQIIYDAARAYDINPQVIIATLQKEQSLITTPNPTASQLNYAMGYGCPDSGGCSVAGFFNQVDNAAWQFRTDMELGSGNNWWGYTPSSYPCNGATRYYSAPLKTGYNVTFKDDHNVSYTNFVIPNMATGTLYCYTPHVYNNPNGLYGLPRTNTGGDYYSGSYNFVYYFTLWFGSTQGGELVRTTTNGQVYIVNNENGKKYPVNDIGVFNDYSPLGLRYVSDAYLSQYATSQPVSNMAQSPNGTLSFITAGIKLPFSSCTGDVVDYGYTCDSTRFIPLTAAQSNKLSNGPYVTKLIKSNSNATVYYMSSGKKRPITSWDDLVNLKIPISINVLSTSSANQFSVGPVVYAPGALVKSSNSNTVYVAKDLNSLMSISSFIYPKELGLGTSVRTMSDSDFQTGYNSANGALALTNKVSCNSNNYVGINGSLYSVSAGMATNFGYSSGDFTSAGSPLCNNLTVNSQSLSQYVRTSDGTIYYVSSGQKRAFGSYATYQSSSYCNNSCTVNQVSNTFASSIPSGANL